MTQASRSLRAYAALKRANIWATSVSFGSIGGGCGGGGVRWRLELTVSATRLLVSLCCGCGGCEASLLAGWVDEFFFSSLPSRSSFIVAGHDLVGPGSDSELAVFCTSAIRHGLVPGSLSTSISPLLGVEGRFSFPVPILPDFLLLRWPFGRRREGNLTISVVGVYNPLLLLLLVLE